MIFWNLNPTTAAQVIGDKLNKSARYDRLFFGKYKDFKFDATLKADPTLAHTKEYLWACLLDQINDELTAQSATTVILKSIEFRQTFTTATLRAVWTIEF